MRSERIRIRGSMNRRSGYQRRSNERGAASVNASLPFRSFLVRVRRPDRDFEQGPRRGLSSSGSDRALDRNREARIEDRVHIGALRFELLGLNSRNPQQ
jgi:hypothetical protein